MDSLFIRGRMMGLDIYFYDKDEKELEGEFPLSITHNLNTLVKECGNLVDVDYYKIIWRPDEILEVENCQVRVIYVLEYLPKIIEDLLRFEDTLSEYLPSNGWGTFEQLISFLCDYIKACYINKEHYIYCCR